MKRLGFYLSFQKKLQPNTTSSCLGLGPDEVGQKSLKLCHLWRHSQTIQNQKKFFIADLPGL